MDVTEKILVTGATGFIGSRLCKRLIDDGWQVRPALRSAGDTDGVVVGELGSQTDWSEAVAGVAAVVHLAARVHVMQDQAADPLAEFRRVNVEGTLNLARQAAEAGVKRFIYLSSVKVNGQSTRPSGRDEGIGSPRPRIKCGAGSNPPLEGEGNKVRVFREDDVPNPRDAYAISKWEAEQGLIALARETGMEVVIIRPPLVYGPGVKGNFLTMLRWLEKGVPLPFGAIHNKRSLVALENLVELIVTCIDHPAAANELFLVSDGEDLSTTELLQCTAKVLGKPARLIPVPQGVLVLGLKLAGKGDLALRLCGSLQVDSSRAREVLGWRPVISMEEQLGKILNFDV